MTPAGIELSNFRFVAQHLNHCATAVPSNISSTSSSSSSSKSSSSSSSMSTSNSTNSNSNSTSSNSNSTSSNSNSTNSNRNSTNSNSNSTTTTDRTKQKIKNMSPWVKARPCHLSKQSNSVIPTRRYFASLYTRSITLRFTGRNYLIPQNIRRYRPNVT